MFWGCVGEVLVICWYCFGYFLGMCLGGSGDVSVMFLVCLWYLFGIVLCIFSGMFSELCGDVFGICWGCFWEVFEMFLGCF